MLESSETLYRCLSQAWKAHRDEVWKSLMCRVLAVDTSQPVGTRGVWLLAECRKTGPKEVAWCVLGAGCACHGAARSSCR
jgi:hypothetical protein